MVNGQPVSVSEMQLAVREIRQYAESLGQTWKPLPAEDQPNALDLRDVLENLIDAELKAQDATARGLDRNSELQRRLAYIQRTLLVQEWDRWHRERALPTETEIKEFYERNKAGFMTPERVRVRQIVAETLEGAESIRARAVQGETFAQLAKEVSIGPGKETGGDIGWYVRALDEERLRIIGQGGDEGVFFPQLEPVAFALEQNQISQPVKGPDARYYIIQLQERKPAQAQSELEVHDTIQELLTAQAMQQKLEELRKKAGAAGVERFFERLQDVEQ